MSTTPSAAARRAHRDAPAYAEGERIREGRFAQLSKNLKHHAIQHGRTSSHTRASRETRSMPANARPET
jgi:hypothetical protein